MGHLHTFTSGIAARLVPAASPESTSSSQLTVLVKKIQSIMV
jgi:hypothetical protein